MILTACSSYFEQLFINFNEPHQVVILKDTSFADIVAIIEFMYKGEINVSQVAAEGSENSANTASAYTPTLHHTTALGVRPIGQRWRPTKCIVLIAASKCETWPTIAEDIKVL